MVACVESDGREEYEKWVEDLLAEGVGAVQPFIPGATKRLADWLIQALCSRPSERRPSWLFFAAALVSTESVEASVAGSFRVHVIKNGTLVATTRDHILKEEDDGVLRFPAGFDHMRGVMGTIPTRVLGKDLKLPPEELSWKGVGPFEVIVCSTDFHRYADPGAYLRLLTQPDVGAVGQHSDDGVVTVIRVPRSKTPSEDS